MMRGATEVPAVFCFSILPLLPGVNGASTQAFKSLIASRAVAAGVGRGELSAWINNLRALCSSVAPVLYDTQQSSDGGLAAYSQLRSTAHAIVGAWWSKVTLPVAQQASVDKIPQAHG